ncbi:hypothetical protein AV274_4435 [Blastocystis sp. ATCC 50177/Nand II]|uniref:Uncharacterized protein n=1 Tax=Blastocystis sp. subtype 1 (strain ATCC 50177 / NandII) TaxID=478820 RepID=A0A196SC83_BLAHN|nr:hypothetical protein AV274_4435 [Blastocystis sp. ATCC 50177/Nand II]
MEEKGFTEIGSTFEDKKETPEEQGAKAEDDQPVENALIHTDENGVVDYDRTWEEDEALGLHDMVVDDKEVEEKNEEERKKKLEDAAKEVVEEEKEDREKEQKMVKEVEEKAEEVNKKMEEKPVV